MTTFLSAVLQGIDLPILAISAPSPVHSVQRHECENYCNGSSVYHGFSANLRKRFGETITNSTHITPRRTRSTIPPVCKRRFLLRIALLQESERSNSLFDQRHRFVFSGLYGTGKVGEGFSGELLLSDWTFAPIIEFSSGRPFNIITRNSDNFQFSPDTGRPDTFVSPTCTALGNPVVNSKFFAHQHF